MAWLSARLPLRLDHRRRAEQRRGVDRLLDNPVFQTADFRVTAASLLACLVVAGLAYNRHFTPARNGGYRRVNWMVIGLAVLALAVMLLVHLVNLLGIETGRR